MRHGVLLLVGALAGFMVVRIAWCWVRRFEHLIRALPPAVREDFCAGSQRLASLPLGAPVVVLMVAICVWRIGISALPVWQALGWVLVVGLLWTLASIDAKTGLLPDHFTAALIVSGLVWQVSTQVDHLPALSHSIGMLCGYGLPMTINLLYRSRGRSQAIGQGDAKLMAGLGLWVGLQPLGQIVMGAIWASLVYTCGHYLFRRKVLLAIPLGPFLAAAATVWILTQVPVAHG